MSDIRQTAKAYIEAGFAVVPLAAGLKKAESSWTSKGYTPADFGPADNIAAKCGEPSNWRVDVDCDHPLAVRAAALLLPQTGLVHGRPGKPASHYWYHCVGAQTTKFTDIKVTDAEGKTKQDTLIEIRSSPGHYTMLPPSVWTDKHDPKQTEVTRWEHERDMLTILPDDLYVAVRDVAIATILAIHWPTGSVKHDMVGPLAGLLCQGGMASTKVVEVIRVAATIAGDTDVQDRVKFAQTTVGKFRAGEKVTGGPKLAEYLDAAVIAKMRGYLKLADLGPLEEMNETHFWVRHGTHDTIGREDTADGRPVFQPVSALYSEYANRTVQTGVDSEGEPIIAPLFKTWLESSTRRQYRQVVFEPPPRVADERDYNLWRGFAVTPDPGPHPETRCAKFLQHMRDVICAGNESHYQYLVKWCAYLVQYPGDRAQIAVSLQGEPGTGKGLFAVTLGRLFGDRYFVQLDQTSDLVGFNAPISGRILVFADEAFWAGDKRQHSVLKRIITEPTLRITLKRVDSHFEPNCLHLIMATNEDHAIQAMFQERRFLSLKVSRERQDDFDYSAALLDEQDHGGREALLAYLLSVPVTKRAILEECPVTDALKHQQLESMNDWQKWLYELLNDGVSAGLTWPVDDEDRWVKSDDFYQSYLAHVGHAKYRLDKNTLGTRLRGLVSARKSTNHRFSGEVLRAWETRTLAEARIAFDEVRFKKGYQGTGDWDELPDGYRGSRLTP